MSKKITLLMVVLAFAVGFLVAGISLAEKTQTQEKAQLTDDLYKELELFSDTVSIIRTDYIDEPKSKDLIYGALKGMLASLDPYSQFMDPDMYEEMKIGTEGEFGGIGIEITIKDGLLTIIAPIDDTPADKAGLKPGDKIVKIEGEITKDLTLLEAVKKLRGKPGTVVNITVLREGEIKLFDFAITRAVIQIESIKKAVFIEPGIAYIRLREFQEKTDRELEEGLKTLEETGIKGLILDLRNNPGGLLDSAVDVAGKFLEEGKTVVSTKGRIAKQNFVFKATNKNKHLNYPMVVLINSGSASASEIVAGGIKDNKRGLIMGTRSFGKGSVQTVIPLSDGSAVRLTTSKYFTPGGYSIHEEGITPDIVVEYKEYAKEDSKEKEEEKIFESLVEQKKETEDDKAQKELEEKKRKEYDNQVLSAADVLKAIVIYEGR